MLCFRSLMFLDPLRLLLLLPWLGWPGNNLNGRAYAYVHTYVHALLDWANALHQCCNLAAQSPPDVAVLAFHAPLKGCFSGCGITLGAL